MNIGNGLRKLAMLGMAIASLGIATNAKALVLTVDDFNTTDLAMAPIAGSSPFGSQSLGWASGGGTIGGHREWVITKTSTGVGSSTLHGIQGEIGDGLAIIAAGLQAKWKASLVWDGIGGGTGTGVIDYGLFLDLSNIPAFTFTADTDLTGVSAKLTLYTDQDHFTEYVISSLLVGESFYSIPLSIISPFSLGQVNLTDVKAIKFDLEATINGTDTTFHIDDLAFAEPPPVPEVSTAVSAAGFALLGGIFLYRSRKVRPLNETPSV